MSTTLTKDIRKHIQYKITAKKQGYYEKQITQTFIEDNPVLDLGDLTPYDGLKYTADNSVPNYRTTTLDFSETVLPFADNTKQNLKMTKYCLHDYRYKYKIPEYRAYLNHYKCDTIGQGPKVNQEDSDPNNHYYYGFNKNNCIARIFNTGTGTTDLNKLTFTIKIKYKKSTSISQFIFKYDDYFFWIFDKTNKLSNSYYGQTSTTFEDGKDYWLQFIYEPTQMVINISTNGTDYTNELTWTHNFTIKTNMFLIGAKSSDIDYPLLGKFYYNQSSLVGRYGTSSNPEVINSTVNFSPEKIDKELLCTYVGIFTEFNFTSLRNLIFSQSYDSNFTKEYTGIKTKCRVSKNIDFLVSISGNTSTCPFEIKGLLRIMPWKRNNTVRFSYKTSKTGSFIDKDITIQNADEWQNFNIKFKDTGISIGYSTTQGATNYTYTDIPNAWFEEGEYELAINGYFNGDTFHVSSYYPMQIDLNGIPGLPFKTEEYQGILYNFEKMNPNSNYNCYCDSNRRVVLVDTASIDESIYTNIGTVNLDKITQNNDDQVVGNPVIELDT